MILERSCSPAPRRADSSFCSSLGLAVRVEPSGYGEPDDPSAHAAWTSRFGTRQQRRSDVRARFPDDLLVAADTVVDVDGTCAGKTARSRRGRPHVALAFRARAPGPHRLCDRASGTRAI